MAMTFADQQTLLHTLLGDDNTDTDDMFPLARRKKEINRGELQLARDTKALREYATGTVASKEITVPSDWMETYVLVVNNKNISNNREISLKDWERYQDWGGEDPYYYYWEFSGVRKIKFLASTSVNGKTYELYYFQKPTTELSDDSDTSLFPEEYREASVYWAAYSLLQQVGKTELSNRYFQVYQRFMREIMKHMEVQHLDVEKPVPDFNIVSPSVTDRQGQGFGGF